MERNVYLDHAATTYVKKEVLEEMMPYFTQSFGNPSSIYKLGQENRKAVDLAKERIAKAIGATPSEIYFTAGGCEADNWVIKGIASANQKKGNHIITTSIEHPAIMNSCKYLEKHGFEVTYLGVDEDGKVRLDELKSAIKDTTILISVMFANNEIGTIQPIAEIAKLAKEKGIYFHTDAVQAVGNLRIDVAKIGVDMLSMAGHKFYGPKGIGALYIKKGTRIDNLIHGGGQEQGKRAGTENVPAIVGMGKAIELAYKDFDQHNERIIALREKLINGVMERIPYVKLNGHRTDRLPGNVNFSFRFIEGESLLLMLNMKGISGSSGSACSSGSLDPSHVLLAIGLDHATAHGSLRLTIGDENTEEDIDYVLEVLPTIVARLREMSPLKPMKEDK
ncbi:MAG: cysteine desulfurase NifS [Clostridia bacterium]|nr:cysteine desulfurase NifS [Clostridia bacterium]